jgi:hypothetical protein
MISAMTMSEGVATNERKECGVGDFDTDISVVLSRSHVFKKREGVIERLEARRSS